MLLPSLSPVVGVLRVDEGVTTGGEDTLEGRAGEEVTDDGAEGDDCHTNKTGETVNMQGRDERRCCVCCSGVPGEGEAAASRPWPRACPLSHRHVRERERICLFLLALELHEGGSPCLPGAKVWCCVGTGVVGVLGAFGGGAVPELAAEALLRVLLGVLMAAEPTDRADVGAGAACSSRLVRSATWPSSASFSDSRPRISACTAPAHAEAQQEAGEHAKV
jgi:hypothetical protein